MSKSGGFVTRYTIYYILYSCCILGCGYQPVSYIKGDSSIAVPIFENNTLWRGCEFELTNVIRNEISVRTPLRLAKRLDEAGLVLSGEIIDYTKPVLVEDRFDRVIQSQVSLTLKVVLRDQRTNKIIYEGCQTEVAQFITSRGESQTTAQREVYEKLARWTVSLLEEPIESR